MKRLILFLIMAVISLNVICAVIDYAAMNHQTTNGKNKRISKFTVIK